MFMLLFAYYLLKVIICSGILYGYYLLALRNKIFHGWNRFYLLSAIILSLVVPLIKIDIFQNTGGPTQVIQLLQVVSTGDEFVYEYTKNGGFHIDATNLSVFIYTVVSIFLLGFLIQTLVRIAKLKTHNNQTIVEGVNFINTKAEGTPFSFFNDIFWNDKIDINSTTGKQIFKHEVAHVQEKHSYDKIFINLVLIFLWCNPFFWLIRKELNIIHEFIADKKALEDSDTAAFAAMILQATYPQQQFTITNNFFYSPLKRRLAMLTKNKNPRINYLSRMLALPLAALVFFAFTLKMKKNNENINQNKYPANVARINAPKIFWELPQNENEIILSNLRSDKSDTIINPTVKIQSFDSLPSIYIVDGKEIPKQELNKTHPSNFETISVLKGESAIKKYGYKGKNGVIEITTKKNIVNVVPPDSTYYDGNSEKKILTLKLKDRSDTLPKNNDDNKVFTKVKVEPSFPGGDIAWTRYIKKVIETNIKEILEENKSGTCRVRFIVNVDGTVSDIRVLSMQGTKLAKVSMDAIAKGPRWVPAIQNGHKVNAYKEQPITFTMRED